jgi:hypothetical protein
MSDERNDATSMNVTHHAGLLPCTDKEALMRTMKAAMVAGTVTALIMALNAPAMGEPVGLVFEDAGEALATDLALTAKAMGWTLAEARAQHDVAERIGRVQEAVAARMPDAYVGGVLSRRPGGAPTLLLKGPADAFVRQVVATAGTPIILADRQPYSLRELQQRSTAVHRALAASGYRQIVTAPDITTARVTATVTARPDLPFSAAGVSATLPGQLRSALDLTVRNAPVSSRESAVFGGMALTRTGLGRLVCTSGWSVSPGGFVGVTTAAHCNVNEAVHNAARHRLDLFDENTDPFIDVEWSTSPVPAPDDFYSNATTVRDVAAVEPYANITVGETVCVYGRS